MNDVAVSTASAAELTEIERVTNTFFAPSKTFASIARGKKSWWLPFALVTVFSYVFFAVMATHIGVHQVAENTISHNQKLESRLAQLTPEQREQTLQQAEKSAAIGMNIGFYASPVTILLMGLICSLAYWATINFGFGGKADFVSVLAVWMFAALPTTLKSVLGAITTFFTVPEAFNITNFAPTSVGAFLSQSETNAALYKLATSLDVTSIWSFALMSIGLAAVAKTKPSAGYITVFGWWALCVLVSVGLAAVMG